MKHAEMLAGLPKDVEEYVLPEGETCSKCDGKLKVVGERIVRAEVEFEPAKLKVKQIIHQVAKCTVCGTEGTENPNCHFQKAAVPTRPLPYSLSTSSLIAQVMYQEFMMGLPFARQERDWYRRELVLPRNDMANWVIRSAPCEEPQAVFFYYSRTQNGNTAKELLVKFYGYLVTDAYSGYEKAEYIIRSLCWAHVHRYYISPRNVFGLSPKISASIPHTTIYPLMNYWNTGT